jgi:hypothetical protein
MMSAYARSRESARDGREAGRLSLGWVILAALLCGGGLFATLYAVILMAGGLVAWAWWLGVIPLVLGFAMLLNPRSGPESAGE